MLLLVQNRALTINREKTYLTAAVAVAGTSLSVKAINANAWADNDWLILGEIGSPTAEVLQVNGAVSNGTSLTIDNAGSGGARYAHAIDEPVYRIDYNQVKFYRSATDDSSLASLLATVALQPENYETRYDDQSNTTGYGFARFFNSQTSSLSPFSDGIPYTGQSARALASMIKKVRSLMDEQNDDFISDSEIKTALNDKQRDVLNERLWTFNEREYSMSSVQYQFEYTKPSTIKTIHSMRFLTMPLRNISEARWEMLHFKTNQNSSTPTNVAIWNDKARIYPTPNASAETTQLNGAISSSDTTIVVDDGGSFSIGDYYRFIIDSEVIYATFYDPDTLSFTGCMRGQEGTTAASHLDNATVTERDIIFDGQQEPVDLEELNDETIVPEPIVLCYGVASDFCLGKLQKETLGDRQKANYKDAIESLRNKYTLKFTSQFGRVRDQREVVTDNGYIYNVNDYPQGVQAPPLIP